MVRAVHVCGACVWCMCVVHVCGACVYRDAHMTYTGHNR